MQSLALGGVSGFGRHGIEPMDKKELHKQLKQENIVILEYQYICCYYC